MKIEVGKTYKTYGGDDVGPMESIRDNPKVSVFEDRFGRKAAFFCPNNGSYDENGVWLTSPEKDIGLNLVLDEDSFEYGKYYMTYSGAIIGPSRPVNLSKDVITDSYGRKAAFFVPNYGTYTKDGIWLTSKPTETPNPNSIMGAVIEGAAVESRDRDFDILVNSLPDIKTKVNVVQNVPQIVAGVYGLVKVAESGAVGFVSTDFNGFVDMTVDELRDAIDVLQQVLEFKEDQNDD